MQNIVNAFYNKECNKYVKISVHINPVWRTLHRCHHDLFGLKTLFLCVCSMEKKRESFIATESDSDTVQKKDGASCEVKWTEEEVSQIFLTATGRRAAG